MPINMLPNPARDTQLGDVVRLAVQAKRLHGKSTEWRNEAIMHLHNRGYESSILAEAADLPKHVIEQIISTKI